MYRSNPDVNYPLTKKKKLATIYYDMFKTILFKPKL